MGLFMKACRKWEEITEFLHIFTINDPKQYKTMLATFKKDVALFYEYGKTPFLTKEKEGNGKIFYTHALCCYMPQLAEKLFKKYNVGLDIATMQAFEHRNKQSKRIVVNKSNGRGNIYMQTFKALYQVLKHRVEW
eukprot:13364743-Ditylum_brightwellii.AAC.1